MRIRRALPADSPIIGQIRIRGWCAAYRDLLPAEVLSGMSDDDREPHRRERLRRPPSRSGAWVVEEEGRVVGFAFTGPTRDATPDRATIGEVSAIYLEPEVLGRGLGRALMARALEDLRVMGYRRASLWVLAENRVARRFYEAAGFRADGGEQTEEMDGSVLHEVRYVMDLAEPAGSVTGSP
jgi:GNAT superfamily N-acetyltransferase